MERELRFDTDDPEFARGFEIGILWERLNSLGSCHMAIHASNAEMVMRVAKATGCEFFGQEIDDDRIVGRAVRTELLNAVRRPSDERGSGPIRPVLMLLA